MNSLIFAINYKKSKIKKEPFDNVYPLKVRHFLEVHIINDLLFFVYGLTECQYIILSLPSVGNVVA